MRRCAYAARVWFERRVSFARQMCMAVWNQLPSGPAKLGQFLDIQVASEETLGYLGVVCTPVRGSRLNV